MSDNKHIQKTLTPIILKEGMAGYDTVKDIEEKLNDPEVFNIAITGPYGSGKSTVLKSLKEQYGKNHRFLTISLASLTGKTDDSDNNGNEQPLKPEEQAKKRSDRSLISLNDESPVPLISRQSDAKGHQLYAG